MNFNTNSRNGIAERWKETIFANQIFPGFPFKPKGWQAIAFDRDKEGDLRLPLSIWRALLNQLHGRSESGQALVVSPSAITGGIVADQPQPFAVTLNETGVLKHFSEMSTYLPEFFMADETVRWAIWGDSDLTVLGGEPDLIASLLNEMGGPRHALEAMLRSFGVSEGMKNDMTEYLKTLISVRD